ncbi:MmcQ/YjbR family DNA-binding protein [Nguyenibacter sp. L1]|uniref:MmcQ/YjbR family DNA-binding protein n=1 Tax=Nguyenibacter sp. L1 TaxID=3049350 RepID=UPI002B463C05|nr:MmcQ/YjbR family DNA-binding protein [Nguyenibacter sp. L1]WRH89683.1 MmcQ/YjbR family DNA-binding protein [Nguyenibacter sp. L1]
MVTVDDFNAFCRALPATTYVMQWGGAHVWKVGGKVFAIGSVDGARLMVTFKAGELFYEILRERPGLRPAPYLASRGLKWIQHFAAPGPGSDGLGDDGPGDDELRDHIRRSHRMVAQGLSKKARAELGLGAA